MKNYTPEINEIVLDQTTKDYVLVTNGVPVLDEQGRETRKLRNDAYLEGIVIRSVLSDGLYWSYISLQGHSLCPTRVTRDEWQEAMGKTQGRI